MNETGKFAVTFLPAGKNVTCMGGERLLEVARQHGVRIAADCGATRAKSGSAAADGSGRTVRPKDEFRDAGGIGKCARAGAARGRARETAERRKPVGASVGQSESLPQKSQAR